MKRKKTTTAAAEIARFATSIATKGDNESEKNQIIIGYQGKCAAK